LKSVNHKFYLLLSQNTRSEV